MGDNAGPSRSPGNRLRARPTSQVVIGEPPGNVRLAAAGEHPAEDNGVFERLAAALAEVGGHRVGRVADKHDVALGVAAQRRQLVDVQAQHRVRVGRLEQGRDRVVPGPEPLEQFRQPAVVRALGRVGGGVAVDPAVRQRRVIRLRNSDDFYRSIGLGELADNLYAWPGTHLRSDLILRHARLG